MVYSKQYVSTVLVYWLSDGRYAQDADGGNERHALYVPVEIEERCENEWQKKEDTGIR